MLINCTPHEVYDVKTRICLPHNADHELRTECVTNVVRITDGITVVRTDVRIKDSLPPIIEGVTYVVSALCLTAVPTARTDFVCPGNPVRDNKGQVYGCRGFRCV